MFIDLSTRYVMYIWGKGDVQPAVSYLCGHHRQFRFVGGFVCLVEESVEGGAQHRSVGIPNNHTVHGQHTIGTRSAHGQHTVGTQSAHAQHTRHGVTGHQTANTQIRHFAAVGFLLGDT